MIMLTKVPDPFPATLADWDPKPGDPVIVHRELGPHDVGPRYLRGKVIEICSDGGVRYEYTVPVVTTRTIDIEQARSGDSIEPLPPGDMIIDSSGASLWDVYHAARLFAMGGGERELIAAIEAIEPLPEKPKRA